jgi:MGT family glycosyltransferase
MELKLAPRDAAGRARARRRRFLFVVPPFTGHVNLVQAVAVELATRGHRVAWLGPRQELRPLLPRRARLFDLHSDAYEHARAVLSGRAEATRPIWLELGLAALRSAEAAIDDFRPDALIIDRLRAVSDALPVAGALAARRRGLPWATSASGAFVPRPDDLRSPETSRAARTSYLAELQLAVGLEPMEWPFDSPHLVLVFSTATLLGQNSDLPPHYRAVGPALGQRDASIPFPWEELRERPRVLVSLGTVSRDRGQAFYATVVEALGGTNVQVILSAPPELVPEAPPNVLVRPYVPQLALLPHVDAVVCHGGQNTVYETLAHGLPLVLAPIMADQPENSRQVADAGAGIVVPFRGVTSRELRVAVAAVLSEPRYQEAAERVKTSFDAAGGAPAAADALEELVS